MSLAVHRLVFSLYEQRKLRNWFYTLAFAIFVPTGCRFAILAWQYGDWFDKPLSIVAGIIIGITAMVTLVRIWSVPPQRTLESAAAEDKTPAAPPTPYEMHAAAKFQAARNREIARGAAALGSTRSWPLGH